MMIGRGADLLHRVVRQIIVKGHHAVNAAAACALGQYLDYAARN